MTSGDCAGGGICEDLSALCTDATCGDDAQCLSFGFKDPTGLYVSPIAQIGSLLDGITEYRSRFDEVFPGSFCSDWNGDLLVERTLGCAGRDRADLTASTHRAGQWELSCRPVAVCRNRYKSVGMSIRQLGSVRCADSYFAGDLLPSRPKLRLGGGRLLRAGV